MSRIRGAAAAINPVLEVRNDALARASLEEFKQMHSDHKPQPAQARRPSGQEAKPLLPGMKAALAAQEKGLAALGRMQPGQFAGNEMHELSMAIVEMRSSTMDLRSFFSKVRKEEAAELRGLLSTFQQNAALVERERNRLEAADKFTAGGMMAKAFTESSEEIASSLRSKLIDSLGD